VFRLAVAPTGTRTGTNAKTLHMSSFQTLLLALHADFKPDGQPVEIFVERPGACELEARHVSWRIHESDETKFLSDSLSGAAAVIDLFFFARRAQGARAGRDRLSFRGWLVYGTEAERKEEWKSHLIECPVSCLRVCPTRYHTAYTLQLKLYILSFDKLTSDKVGEFLESRHTTLRLSCRSTFVLGEYLMP